MTVVGATKPGIGESTAENPDRYSATATAPRPEIDRLMGGDIHGRQEKDESLESEQACRARAETLLAEDRGEWTVGGTLDITPGGVAQPGFTYHVEEFDDYAPAIFSPVWCTLRSVSHSYGPAEASVDLDFADESALVQRIREDLLPESAPRSIDRRTAQLNQANPNYTPPENLAYEYGSGVWGTGKFGGTLTEVPDQSL